jgi:flagellar motor switch protein FliM
MHTQFVNIATPTEMVITTTFNIELAGGSAALHICLPYATVEPIRDIINSTLRGDQSEPDRRWARMLTDQVKDAEVELVANLATTTLTIGQLLQVKVGDVLSVDIAPSVVADVHGVQLFQARYGALNGRYALKVERMLASVSEPLP